MILSFAGIFRGKKPESIVLLLGFVGSEKFVQVGSQIGITLRNHTEDCRIKWFDIIGLLRSDSEELGFFCVFLNLNMVILLYWLL